MTQEIKEGVSVIFDLAWFKLREDYAHPNAIFLKSEAVISTTSYWTVCKI
jgi:hypothetical protein